MMRPQKASTSQVDVDSNLAVLLSKRRKRPLSSLNSSLSAVLAMSSNHLRAFIRAMSILFLSSRSIRPPSLFSEPTVLLIR
ncbi:hypothetical protein MLD38_001338 [Melastoma candidum]|uniref:Uncharacterized protein n=1 Tax=Melastoma candidum TaxID=119954 RepID=A0ACB9SGV5_9MYRT|nr:hypothetical protein MLD38_001338 [Melastoma candidum]